jgi:hypothetical protein
MTADVLVVDREFQAPIPRATPDERAPLEANLLAAGRAHDPLVCWHGVILDGHHRLATCHGLHDVTDLACANRDDAKTSIIRHRTPTTPRPNENGGSHVGTESNDHRVA